MKKILTKLSKKLGAGQIMKKDLPDMIGNVGSHDLFAQGYHGKPFPEKKAETGKIDLFTGGMATVKANHRRRPELDHKYDPKDWSY